MLVFHDGKWQDVALPVYMDPSWGVTEQTYAAYSLLAGLSWSQIELAVYQESFGKSIAAHNTVKKSAE